MSPYKFVFLVVLSTICVRYNVSPRNCKKTLVNPGQSYIYQYTTRKAGTHLHFTWFSCMHYKNRLTYPKLAAHKDAKRRAGEEAQDAKASEVADQRHALHNG